MTTQVITNCYQVTIQNYNRTYWQYDGKLLFCIDNATLITHYSSFPSSSCFSRALVSKYQPFHPRHPSSSSNSLTVITPDPRKKDRAVLIDRLQTLEHAQLFQTRAVFDGQKILFSPNQLNAAGGALSVRIFTRFCLFFCFLFYCGCICANYLCSNVVQCKQIRRIAHTGGEGRV